MVVAFTVPGAVCGKNQAYVRLRKDVFTRSGRRMGLILSSKGREYKRLINLLGRCARDESAWPRDPLIPKKVCLTVQAYGTRHDAGAATQIIKDALQGVFYADDKIVSQGAEEPSIRNGSAPHVDVTVELLETHSEQDVALLTKASVKKRSKKSTDRRIALL